jgi:L-arabinose transport system permease protein
MKKFLSRNLEHLGMAVLCLIVLAAASVFVEGFATAKNASGLLFAISTVGILCCSMLLCLVSGDFDLSIGSVVALSGVLAVEMANRSGSLIAGVAAGFGAGAAVGLLNGVVVAYLRINPLITTLATMQAARGLAYIVVHGKTVSPMIAGFGSLGGSFQIPWGHNELGDRAYLPLAYAVVVLGVCLVIFGILLHTTVFGRSILAMGGNEEAARLAGIPVQRTRMLVFVIQGLMAALAGILLAAKIQIGDPKAEVGLELKVISACVLGGVALTGGRGTIMSIIWGMLIMGAVQRAMELQGFDSFWQLLISGGILLAAVIIDRLKSKLA